jgi:hypothetical protein
VRFELTMRGSRWAMVLVFAVAGPPLIWLATAPVPLRIIDEDGSGTLGFWEIFGSHDFVARPRADGCVEYLRAKDGSTAGVDCPNE